jgi:hypothetical protein
LSHGFVVHCFEDGESWGFFLTEAASFSSPEVEIEMGGQALEKWPRQLFVNSERALEALDFFLKTGKQNGSTGSDPTHFLARSCGKLERVERRGSRGRNGENTVEACVPMLLDV